MISNSSRQKLNNSNNFSLNGCRKINFARRMALAQHRKNPKTALISGFAKSSVLFTSDRNNRLKIVLKSGRRSEKTLKHRRRLIT